MGTIKATLPYPPSANRYWRVGKNGRPYATQQAKNYKQLVWVQMFGQDPIIDKPVYVIVDVYRPIKRGDLDNSLKILLDSIQGFAYKDDKQIKSIHTAQGDDKQNPRVEIFVTADYIQYIEHVQQIMYQRWCREKNITPVPLTPIRPILQTVYQISQAQQ